MYQYYNSYIHEYGHSQPGPAPSYYVQPYPRPTTTPEYVPTSSFPNLTYGLEPEKVVMRLQERRSADESNMDASDGALRKPSQGGVASRGRRPRRRRSSRGGCSDFPENNKGRTLMRPWLEQQIKSGKIEGLRWENEERGIFRVPWRHASRHGWELDSDACLFRNWAKHTGKYEQGTEATSAKKWKANFRCALNSLPTVQEVVEQTNKRGPDAFKVYQFLSYNKNHVGKTETDSQASPSPPATHKARYVTRSQSRVSETSSYSCSQQSTQSLQREEEDMDASLHIDMPESPQYVVPSSISISSSSSSISSTHKPSVLPDVLLKDVDHSYAATQPAIPTVVETMVVTTSQHEFRGPMSTEVTTLYPEPTSPPSDDDSWADSGYGAEDHDGLLAEVLSEMEGEELSPEFCKSILETQTETSSEVLSEVIAMLQRDCASTMLKAVVTQPIQGTTDFNITFSEM